MAAGLSRLSRSLGLASQHDGRWMGDIHVYFMLIFLGLVIAGIVLLVRYLSPHARSKPSEDALEILKRRYARGEIQKAEFEEKRKDLES
jgi:putative membrane protein